MEHNITKLTLEQYEYKTSWETEYSNQPIEDIIQGFCGLLYACGWMSNGVIDALGEYAIDHGYKPDDWRIHEICKNQIDEEHIDQIDEENIEEE